ncbi:MAG: carboxypeptidase-like regulatory domain-containing protein [Chloroflexi bacterium]|nr:carboxypeptidase-like regulatory domain-containing protein [Chloroflexota bacterium]
MYLKSRMTGDKFYISRLLVAFLLFLLLFIPAGCGSGGGGGGGGGSAPEPPTTGGVDGYLYTDDGAASVRAQAPLPGATVRIRGRDECTVTNSEGYFKFDNLPPGNYIFYFIKCGYTIKEKTQAVTAGQVSGIVETTVVSTDPDIAYLDPETPRQGGASKIYGVNFGAAQGGGGISFGGINSPNVWIWQDDMLVCKAPENAASGNLLVTADAGGSTSSSVSILNRQTLDLGSNAAPSGGGAAALTVNLTGAVTNVNGAAFILTCDTTKLTLNTSVGDNGVVLAPGLSGASLITHVDGNRLWVGITLKGNVISGPCNLCTVSFIPVSGQANGTLCSVSVDSTKSPKLCRKPGGSPVFESPLYNGGTVVVRQ